MIDYKNPIISGKNWFCNEATIFYYTSPLFPTILISLYTTPSNLITSITVFFGGILIMFELEISS